MAIASITDFFKEIVRDLHTSLYLALGGSVDEESLDWSSQAVELASTAIKILILLAVLGFFYWLAIYILKQSRTKIRLNERRTKIVRSVLRYIWIVASLIAIMSQIYFNQRLSKLLQKPVHGRGFIMYFGRHLDRLSIRCYSIMVSMLL